MVACICWHRFLSAIDVKRALAQHFPHSRRNSHYSTGELVLAMLYPIIVGIKRLETTRLLRTNRLFQYLTGLRSYPYATTLRRCVFRSIPITHFGRSRSVRSTDRDAIMSLESGSCA